MVQAKAVQPLPDDLSALAEIVLSVAGTGTPMDAARGRLQTELAKRRFDSVRAYAGSLTEDPAQAGDFYLAADGIRADWAEPLLLMFRFGAVATRDRFANPLLALDLQLSGARKVGLKAYSFSSRDHDTVGAFAKEVSPVFLPRPQRALPAVATGNRHPEISLPAAFAAFGTILEKFGATGRPPSSFRPRAR